MHMLTATEFLNESDVEQKLLFKLLTEDYPLGFGIFRIRDTDQTRY